jgi:uncharacterized membrane protein
MTRADTMIVLGSVIAVGFAAFIFVVSKFPDITALGWLISLGAPIVSTALIVVGLLTRNRH